MAPTNFVDAGQFWDADVVDDETASPASTTTTTTTTESSPEAVLTSTTTTTTVSSEAVLHPVTAVTSAVRTVPARRLGRRGRGRPLHHKDTAPVPSFSFYSTASDSREPSTGSSEGRPLPHVMIAAHAPSFSLSSYYSTADNDSHESSICSIEATLNPAFPASVVTPSPTPSNSQESSIGSSEATPHPASLATVSHFTTPISSYEPSIGSSETTLHPTSLAVVGPPSTISAPSSLRVEHLSRGRGRGAAKRMTEKEDVIPATFTQRAGCRNSEGKTLPSSASTQGVCYGKYQRKLFASITEESLPPLTQGQKSERKPVKSRTSTERLSPSPTIVATSDRRERQKLSRNSWAVGLVRALLGSQAARGSNLHVQSHGRQPQASPIPPPRASSSESSKGNEQILPPSSHEDSETSSPPPTCTLTTVSSSSTQDDDVCMSSSESSTEHEEILPLPCDEDTEISTTLPPPRTCFTLAESSSSSTQDEHLSTPSDYFTDDEDVSWSSPSETSDYSADEITSSEDVLSSLSETSDYSTNEDTSSPSETSDYSADEVTPEDVSLSSTSDCSRHEDTSSSHSDANILFHFKVIHPDDTVTLGYYTLTEAEISAPSREDGEVCDDDEEEDEELLQDMRLSYYPGMLLPSRLGLSWGEFMDYVDPL